MNTHDMIELPPLPSPFGIVDPMGSGEKIYTLKDMGDYARAYALTAVEADRKRRGEPVAWSANTNVNPRPTYRRPPPSPPSPPAPFQPMVRKDSAPQPAEPVKVLSEDPDALTTAYWVGYHKGKRAAARTAKDSSTTAEPVKVPSMIDLIADDAYAATFQSVGQYRRALLARYTTTKEQT